MIHIKKLDLKEQTRKKRITTSKLAEGNNKDQSGNDATEVRKKFKESMKLKANSLKS